MVNIHLNDQQPQPGKALGQAEHKHLRDTQRRDSTGGCHEDAELKLERIKDTLSLILWCEKQFAIDNGLHIVQC